MIKTRRPPNPRPARSGFQAEAQRFRDLLGRWAEHELNRLFDMSIDGGRHRRAKVLFGLLAFTVAAICLHLLLQAPAWQPVGSLFRAAALPSVAGLDVVRTLLIMGIASSVAMHFASAFLADVFEIRDLSVARRFIRGAALGSGEDALHIRAGKIADEDRDSPVVLIGGPGTVLIDFDSAALFEKPDGAPHVIGQLARAPDEAGNMVAAIALGGFERLREPIINLRDQYIGSPSGEPMTVFGRSLDGLPVSVTDVRGVFSVRRAAADESKAESHRAFEVRARDIEDLIYKQAVPVLTRGEHASGEPGDWTQVMQDLIQGSLRDFMSQNRLADFLAGVGTQEVELSEFRDDTILSRALQVSPEAAAPSAPGNAAKARFRPRTDLSSRFRKHSSEFSMRTQEHGLELHWIGVGTWTMPDEGSHAAVNERHFEAWRMSRENTQRSEPAALAHVAEAAAPDWKLRLIQETPIQSHDKNQARYADREVLIESLLQDFWEQLGQALNLYYRRGTASPELESVEQAVLQLEELLKIRQRGYLIGGGTMSRVRPRSGAPADQDRPPAPSSRTEAAQYQKLLARLDGDYRVAEAMIANEARRHTDLRREDLIGRIVQRLERHGS